MALCKLWIAEVKEDPSIISAAIQHSLLAFGYKSIKPIQAEAVQAVLRGSDVFVTVPTGYGKSLIFQILPLCARFLLEFLKKTAPSAPAVLVVSPLTALMQDQASKLSFIPGISPVLFTDCETLEDKSPASGGWTHIDDNIIILASPEAILGSSRGRKMLLSDIAHSFVAVVIDEAHCIVKW